MGNTVVYNSYILNPYSQAMKMFLEKVEELHLKEVWLFHLDQVWVFGLETFHLEEVAMDIIASFSRPHLANKSCMCLEGPTNEVMDTVVPCVPIDTLGHYKLDNSFPSTAPHALHEPA